MLSEKDRYWMTGFIEGEGSFFVNACVRKPGIGFQPVFRIALSEKDRKIIEKIKDMLGFGKIQFKSNETWRKRGMFNPQSQYAYVITKVEDVQRFIEIFDEDLFLTSKKEDFILWKRAFNIIKNYEHLSYRGFVKICEIRDMMNKKIKSKNYKNKEWLLSYVKKNKIFFSEKNIQKRKNASMSMRLLSKISQSS
jgi:hypothetical protein